MSTLMVIFNPSEFLQAEMAIYIRSTEKNKLLPEQTVSRYIKGKYLCISDLEASRLIRCEYAGLMFRLKKVRNVTMEWNEWRLSSREADEQRPSGR